MLGWWQLAAALVIGASRLQPKSLAQAAVAGAVPALLGTAIAAVIRSEVSAYHVVAVGLMLASAPCWPSRAGLRPEVVPTLVAAAGLAYGFRAASPLNDL